MICEKPFVTRPEQAEELFALAESKELFLYEAAPISFLPNYAILKRELPKVGRVRLVMANYSQYSGRYDKLLAGELPNIFRKGAEKEGHTVEKVSLYDKSIGFCRACYACFRSGKCVIQDDMAEILAKMQDSDVIVIATPTYFLTMNGMLKTTIDRFLPKWQELGGHDVYFIITGHDGKEG